jgi:RNA polymerase sigma factor (sigma-70 family)
MEANAPKTTRQVVEAILVDRARRGKLCAYAHSRFGICADDAQDLLQETAIELLRHQAYVRAPDAFVFSVFRTRCARFIDSRRIDRDRFDDATLIDDAPDGGRADGLDRRVALRKALNSISSACRRLLCAYYFEGESLREAGRRLSLAHSSVEKTIGRCLERLRRCLA